METKTEEDFLNKLKEYLPPEEHPSYLTWKNYHLNAVKRGLQIADLIISVGIDLKGKHIVDIGCGTCGVYVAFAISGSEVVGIDIFRDSLKAGKARIRGSGFGANLIMASAQHLPFRSNTFDIAIFSDVIEHTQSPDICTKEIYNILDDGGLLYGTGPNFLSILNLAHDPHYRLPLISILPPSVGQKIAKKTGRGVEKIKMFTMWDLVKLFSAHRFRVFMADYPNIKKSFSEPQLANNNINRILIRLLKRMRSDRVALWIIRVFYNSVYIFMCMKASALKDVDSKTVYH